MALGAKTISGAAWTIATNLGSRGVSLVGTLVLARFLDPAEYGEVLGASVVASTAMVLSSLGLGQYLVANPKAGREAGWHVTFYSVGLCAVLLGIGLLVDEHIGPFFKVDNLSQYLPWFVLVTMLDRIASVPERILYRDMRFRLVGLNNAVGEVLFPATALPLAALGWGGMSIVWGNIARSLFRVSVIVWAVDRREWLDIGPVRWAKTREIFSFGLPLCIGNIASFASRRWDNMLTSKFFGPALMGAYNLAYNLADMPASQVGEQIGDVLLPQFAQLPPKQRRVAFVQAVRMLALIMFPMAIGLGAVADTLVRAFFDDRWTQVAPMLTLLSALSLTRPIGYAVASFLQAEGRPMTVSLLEFAKVGTLFGTMLLLGPIGPLWVCVAVGVGFALHALLALWVVRGEGTPFWGTLGGLLPPLLACAPMIGAVLAVRWATALVHLPQNGKGAAIGLCLEVLVGGVVFVASALVIARTASRELITLAREAMARRRAPRGAEPTAAQQGG